MKVSTVYIAGSVVATIYGGALIIKDRIGGGVYEGKEKLAGKVVIVTGANTGIGKETAHALAQREAKVVMACRDMEKCEMARVEIVLGTKNKYVYCRKCDLSSLKSIRQFAEEFKKEHPRLDILVNNAGVMRCPKTHTEDAFEMQLGVNHMGHFLLTNLLLDTLKASAPSRIVNVSSAAHRRGKINVDDLNSEEAYDPSEAYAQSKLANILFTRELAKKLQGTKVTVNAVHPGLVGTDITRHMSFHDSYISTVLLKPLVYPFIKSPKQGAATVLFMALDKNLENVSGKYFVECKESDVSEEAKKDNLAKWLWLTSEKWTRIKV